MYWHAFVPIGHYTLAGQYRYVATDIFFWCTLFRHIHLRSLSYPPPISLKSIFVHPANKGLWVSHGETRFLREEEWRRETGLINARVSISRSHSKIDFRGSGEQGYLKRRGRVETRDWAIEDTTFSVALPLSVSFLSSFACLLLNLIFLRLANRVVLWVSSHGRKESKSAEMRDGASEYPLQSWLPSIAVSMICTDFLWIDFRASGEGGHLSMARRESRPSCISIPLRLVSNERVETRDWADEKTTLH